MELSPGRQRLLFVVVVIVLVGLGIFVIRGRNHDNAAAPAATPATSASSSPAAPSDTATASDAATAVPPATVPPATSTPTPAAAGGADIYQWLPFSQSDLTTAANTTLAFAKVYANTSYTETKAAYVGKLSGLTTPQEAATLVSDFETPGIAATRTADKQVATGTPTIESISSFGPQGPPAPSGPPSITFAVTIAQKLASTSGTLTSTPEYNITIVSTPSGWLVQTIQLASLGNE